MSAATITMALMRLLSEWAAGGHTPLMLAVSACAGFVAGMAVLYLALRRPLLLGSSIACAAALFAAIMAARLAPDGAAERAAAACASLWAGDAPAFHLADLVSAARKYMLL